MLGVPFYPGKSPAFTDGGAFAMEKAPARFERNDFGNLFEPVIRNSQYKICFRICCFCESLQGIFAIDGRDYSY
jgi:hypothetical protein